MSKAGEVYNVPRGTAYLTTQQIITYTTYLIFYVALARILRPDEVGQVSLLLAAQAAFVALTQLGLPSAATRYVSGNIGKNDRETAGAVARTILRLSTLIGAVGFAIAALVSPLVGPSVIGSSDAGTLLILTFLSGFLLDIILVYGAYFIGVGAYARNLYQNALYIPFSRGLGLLLAILGYRVTGIVSGWLIGGLAAVLLSSYLWHGQLPERSSHPIKPLLAFSLPVFGSALIAFGQQYGDITILQAIIGQLSTTGAYYLIVSSVSFLSVLWIPVTQALYPALSASHAAGGTEAVSERLAVAFRLTTIAVLLAVGVGVPLAIVDNLLIGHLSPFRRLPILIAVFVLAFLAISRAFSIFRASDFAILKDALPHRFHPQLRAIEHLIVGRQQERGHG